MLAYELDGQPLPVDHGGPLRSVCEGKYFYKSVKWLTRIELLAEDERGIGNDTRRTTTSQNGAAETGRPQDNYSCHPKRRDEPLRAGRVAPAGLVDLDHVRAVADRADDLHPHVPAASVGSQARTAEARRATARTFDLAVEPCAKVVAQLGIDTKGDREGGESRAGARLTGG
jgi:hypothetical protein